MSNNCYSSVLQLTVISFSSCCLRFWNGTAWLAFQYMPYAPTYLAQMHAGDYCMSRTTSRQLIMRETSEYFFPFSKCLRVLRMHVSPMKNYTKLLHRNASCWHRTVQYALMEMLNRVDDTGNWQWVVRARAAEQIGDSANEVARSYTTQRYPLSMLLWFLRPPTPMKATNILRGLCTPPPSLSFRRWSTDI